MAQTRLRKKIERALREELLGEEGKVVIRKGFEDLLHLYVLSSKFKGKRWSEKAEMIRSILFRRLTEDEWIKVSMIMGLAPGEKNGLLSFEYDKIFGS